jgi:hypothetical protein
MRLRATARDPEGRSTHRRTFSPVDQIMITIDGPNFQDFQEAEVARLPEEGEPIETKYGTCVVTSVEALPASEHFAGKVTCRLS